MLTFWPSSSIGSWVAHELVRASSLMKRAIIVIQLVENPSSRVEPSRGRAELAREFLVWLPPLVVMTTLTSYPMAKAGLRVRGISFFSSKFVRQLNRSQDQREGGVKPPPSSHRRERWFDGEESLCRAARGCSSSSWAPLSFLPFRSNLLFALGLVTAPEGRWYEARWVNHLHMS
jgi:hypothetical protein